MNKVPSGRGFGGGPKAVKGPVGYGVVLGKPRGGGKGRVLKGQPGKIKGK